MDSHVKNHPLHRGATAALAALALVSGALSSGPATAAPDDDRGTVVVKVVDPAGKPVNTRVLLYKQGDSSPDSLLETSPGSGTYSLEVEVGRYGISTISPWGGMTCAGISECSFLALLGASSDATVPGILTVTDSEAPSVFNVRDRAPATITGTAALGKQLSLVWSPAMKALLDDFAKKGAAALGPTVQWLRDGTPIPSAVSTTYQPTVGDVGRVISARLTYPSPLLWDGPTDFDVTPRTVAGRKVAKTDSRTTLDVLRKKVVQGRSPGIRVDVTAGDLPASGRIKIKIGKRTYTKDLRNGSARVSVPRNLKAGRYKIVATYPGNSIYNPSKGTGTFKVVRRR